MAERPLTHHSHLTQQALDAARAKNLGHRVIALANDFADRVLVEYRQRGYDAIRPVHGALLRNLELGGNRLTTLARRGGVTHRAMAKLIDDVVAQGFVTRGTDPDDRRASLIRFTADGRRLLHDSSAIIEHIYADYSALAGAEALETLENRLFEFLDQLHIEITPSGQQAIHPVRPVRRGGDATVYLSHNLGRYLQLAGDDYYRRCAARMAARGHAGIRFDHLSVLGHLNLDGMTQSALARSAGISLQAMGKQVRAVHRLGYVDSRVDPGDRRVRRVDFTPAGLVFIADLLGAFEEIDRDYREAVGQRRLQRLQTALARVVGGLGLRVPAATISRA